jgi:deoxycytidine triphosphate deaminase
LPDHSEETEVISRERGKELAHAWADNPGELQIPDTLLNSDDIIKVINATGLIAPFFTGGGRKSRLKKASYEGRVGSKAYIYRDKNAPERIFDPTTDEYLLIPKNSIVFVESDLDFRLPDFVALRFNLQIQHVHRGLLLGTGPLVDPGFWGKLCIPLHNLTNEDYEIPKSEGLIWLEFTKTTLATDKKDPARVPLEAASHDEKGHWEIEEFLNKAASQYNGHKVPIRSSLPTMFAQANAAAAQSAADAKAAKDDAEKLRSLNMIAMVAAAVGLAALCLTGVGFLTNLSSRNEDLAGKLRSETETAQKAIDDHITDVDRYGMQPAEVRATVPALIREVNKQNAEIADLKKQMNGIKLEAERAQKKAAFEQFR